MDLYDSIDFALRKLDLPLEEDTVRKVTEQVEEKLTTTNKAMVPCCECGEDVTINREKYHCQKCFDKLTAQHHS